MPTVVVEFQLQGPAGDRQGIFGMRHAAAENGIDVDIKLRVLRQPLKFPVEHLQALLGNLIRVYVVDRDLQVFQAGAVQAVYSLRGEQVAIGDDGGDGAVTANGANDFVEVRVEAGGPPLMVMMPVPRLTPFRCGATFRRWARDSEFCRTRCSRRRRDCSAAWG